MTKLTSSERRLAAKALRFAAKNDVHLLTGDRIDWDQKDYESAVGATEKTLLAIAKKLSGGQQP